MPPGLASAIYIRVPFSLVITNPDWLYYPEHDRPPHWVAEFVGVVESCQTEIKSSSVASLTSDKVLGFLRPGLMSIGSDVEAGEHLSEKVRRPVLFGD